MSPQDLDVWVAKDAILSLIHIYGSQAAINLIADIPYVWQTGDLDACLLTHDVTTLTVANSSGEAASFELRIITDATP